MHHLNKLRDYINKIQLKINVNECSFQSSCIDWRKKIFFLFPFLNSSNVLSNFLSIEKKRKKEKKKKKKKA